MNVFYYTKRILITFAIMIICMNVMLWLGIFDSTKAVDPVTLESQLRSDADAGNINAQNKLGTLLYKEARKNNGDFTEAIYWLQAAAKQQDPHAQMNLAFAYKKGQGVPLDNEKAIKLFHQSGLNFLRIDDVLNAKDRVYNINIINSIHPLKRELIDAISHYESSQ